MSGPTKKNPALVAIAELERLGIITPENFNTPAAQPLMWRSAAILDAGHTLCLRKVQSNDTFVDWDIVGLKKKTQ